MRISMNMKTVPKLIRLSANTTKATKIVVKTDIGDASQFTINKAAKQGDALSITLFTLALEYILKNILKNIETIDKIRTRVLTTKLSLLNRYRM